MPIRHVSWQRGGGAAEPLAVTYDPAADEPRGFKRLLYAAPLGTTWQLLLGLVGLIVLVHVAAWALGVHLAWVWGVVAVAALAGFAADWPRARAAPLDDPLARRAALTSRVAFFALLGVAFSFLAF